VGLGEEAITDLLLVEISKRQPYDIITIKFSKNYEAQEGADWEWWILSRSGIIGLRFQAKRVHLVRGSYEYTHLDYLSGNKHQVDILIDHSQNLGMVPLYIFYNFWDLDFPFYRFINPSINNLGCCRLYSRRNLGIAIASAFDVKDLVKQNPPKKSLSDVLPVSWPIYCLTCCNFSDLSESVSKFISRHILKKEHIKEYDFKVFIHDKIPEEVYLRLKGEFKDDAPMYTSYIIDLEAPHKEYERIKSLLY